MKYNRGTVNRFPSATVVLLLCIMSVVFSLCRQPVQSDPMAPPSPSPPVDRAALKEKARETLAFSTDGGPLAGRIRLQRALYGPGDEGWGLMKTAMERGTVYDRETVVSTLFETGERGEAGDSIVSLLLADDSYLIRERTIYHLSLEGNARWLPSIRKALGDDDYYVRATAARALGRMGEKEAIPALLALSSKEVGWSRLCVLQALVMLGHEGTARIMKELARGSPSAKERAYALGMLYEAGEAPLLPALRDMMTDPDDRAREIACRYLVRVLPPGEGDLFSRIIAKGDFHALRGALVRLRETPAGERGTILSGAFAAAADRRRDLLSLFGKEEPDPLRVYGCACRLRSHDVLALLLEHLFAVNRERAGRVARELLQDEGVRRTPPYPESIVSALAEQGDDRDLEYLSLFLDEGSDGLKKSAALAMLRILSRGESPSPGK